MTDGAPWTDNILVLSSAWGANGTATNLNWGSQPGGTYNIVSVLWSGTVCAILAYVSRSPENMRSAARHVCDNILRDNGTARLKILSAPCSILCNLLVNQRYCSWDDLWDEPVDQ